MFWETQKKFENLTNADEGSSNDPRTKVGLRWLSRLSDVLPPLRARVRSLYRESDRTWEEFVNTLPKVVGFLWVLLFTPTGKVDRVGYD